MEQPPLLLHTARELRDTLSRMRAEGLTLGFVPTMGALHTGHMALVDAAKKHCDKVAVSIFVNPKQFGEGEDFSRYPRMVDKDVALLTKHHADILFLPDSHILYPEGFASEVRVKGLDGVLDGVHRPGHFNGVATVVSLLMNLFSADKIFFGEKDWQQLTIIRRMVKDLHLPGEILGVPTVREADGLALSSRNQYLSKEERAIAPLLHQAMQQVKSRLGKEPLALLLEEGRNALLAGGFSKLDYFEARDAHTLAPSEDATHARLFAALWLGSTRLIDNISLNA